LDSHAHISLASATRWQLQTNAALRSLEKDPDQCPLADEAADIGIDLRELHDGRGKHVFRAVFTIDGTTVNVHRVRHAAQDRLDADDI